MTTPAHTFTLRSFLRTLPLLAALLALAVGARANPTGGSVAAGSATIATSGNTLTVTQGSGRAIINWQDFSNAAGEITRFIQPDATSATLNRVVSGQPSSLFGNIQANGQVFLINPNGILVGAGARIDTGGFLASTLDVANQDFLAGGDLRFSGGSTAAVKNLGAVNALGGDVFLIARVVENAGTVTAGGGTAGVAAGSEILLTTGGSERLFVLAGSSPGTTINSGTITGTTAELKAAGGNAYAFAINNTGLVRATGSAERGGKLWLVAESGDIINSGTLDVSSATGQGGDLKVTGERVSLDLTSHLNASGATGGGTMFVLGGAEVNVDGKLEARATASGDGGFVETSAAHVAVAGSARVTTTAASGQSGTWLIDPVDFTISAGSGALTTSGIGATTLSNNLGSTSVSIATDASTGGNGDIFVNDAVSWSANKLTLSAHRNIAINASLTGSGTASLALEYGQATSNGGSSDYTLNNGVQVTLPAGSNFSTKLGSGGTRKDYTVITSLGAAGDEATGPATLQGMAKASNLATNYALGANIDASATSTWNTNAGFQPIGDFTTKFTGNFAGLGHTISSLTINRPSTDNVGLFGDTGTGSTIRNVGLVGGSVSGHDFVGGLVGYGNPDTFINTSYATGSVSGTNNVGGLVGYNHSTISNSYATGSVSGTVDYVGGLVGLHQNGAINTSYATGVVSGTGASVGGLVGSFEDVFGATINNSYWNKETTGRTSSSGSASSAGLTTAQMKQQASFTGFDFTNTWVLYEGQSNPLLRSFLTPLTVTANNATKTYDGLTSATGNGVTYSTTPNSNLLGTATYTAGSANAGSQTLTPGGLYSNQQGYLITFASGTLTVDKADLTLGGTRVYDGTTLFAGSNLTATGVHGETFTVTGAGASGNLGTKNVQTNQALANLTGLALGTSGNGGLAGNYNSLTTTGSSVSVTAASLTLSTSNVSKTYDGGLSAAGTAAVSSGTLFSGDTLSGGTFAFTDKNAGSNKTVTTTGVTVNDGNSGGNYTVSYANNTASTITPYAVSLTGSRVYDGTANVAAGAFTLGTLVGTETLALTGSGTVADKNVGAGKTVTLGTLALGNGSGLATNYTFTGGTQTAAITAASLTLSTSNVSKTYDGGLSAAGTAAVSSGTLFSGDTLSGGTFAFTDKNAGSNKTVTTTGVTVNDGNSGGNYTVSYANNTTSTINPYAVSLTGSRVYDGTANVAAGALTLGTLVGTETLALTGTGTVASKDVGTGKTVTLGSLALGNGTNGGLAANYTFTGGTHTADITARAVSLTGTRTYDGTTNVAAGAFTLGTLVGTETLALSGTGTVAGKDVGTGKAVTLGTLTLGNGTNGGLAGNYTFTGGTQTADITAATLTYTANAASRVYGLANPAFSGTVTGFVGGETQGTATTGTLSFSTTATSLSPAGSYALTGAGLTANFGNYVFAQAPGNATAFTIGSQVALTITANDATRLYGAANPVFTASYAGFINGDTSSSVTGLQFSTTATTSSNVGTYAITPFGATAPASYVIGYVPGILTINPAALSLTANSTSRLYGAANPVFTASYSGLVNGDTSAVVTGLQFSTPATMTSNVGGYAITPSGASASNYTLGYAPGTLTINPATLTYTANAASRPFGAANPAFSGTVTGFVNGETQGTATTGTLSFSTTATSSSSVGSYALTGSGLTANHGNYVFAQAPGNATAFTIGSPSLVPLTITADNKTKTYGAALPAFTASYAGFINGDTAANVTGLQFSTTATMGSNVGTFTITPFGATAPAAYVIGYVPGTLTINPAALSYTANAASRPFGAANPAFSGTVTGFVNGDTQGGATTGTLSFSTTATSTSPVGSYALTGSGLTANNGNYVFVQAPGNATAFTIGAPSLVPLTITADNKTKTYGAALPAFTASYAGFINGDTSSSVTGLQFSTTAAISSNVGTYTITPFGATAPTTYLIGYVPGILTINPAALTLTANSTSRLYGAANPAFTASYSGLVNGDTSAAVSGLQFGTAATTTSGVGSYALTLSGATAANYTLSYVPGTLTINPALLTLTANNAEREFGAANPVFTGIFSGFVNGDTSAVVTGLAFTTPATGTSTIGDYAITPTAAASNYTLAFVNGTLRVLAPTVMAGGAPVPVVIIGQQPMLTASLALIQEGDRLVLVSLGSSDGVLTATDRTSVDERLALTLGETAGARPAAVDPVRSSGPNLGGFELVAALPASSSASPVSLALSPEQLSEPGLVRETSVSQGRFDIIYQEALTAARQQTESNTAVGSSYRDFREEDKPETNLVRPKPGASSSPDSG